MLSPDSATVRGRIGTTRTIHGGGRCPETQRTRRKPNATGSGTGCAAWDARSRRSPPKWPRQFNLRPRLAWRYALGWPQWKLAQRHNTLHPGAKLTDARVSDHESWPHGGSPPGLRYLARLATTYGHGCTAAQLVDADDLEHLNPDDRRLLTTTPATIPTDEPDSPTRATPKRRARTAAGRSAGELVIPTDPAGWATAMGLPKPGDLAVLLMTCLGSPGPFDCDAPATPAERDRAYHQLVRFLTSWAHTMKRRLMLRTLGWAATAAAVGYSLDLDEQSRVAGVLSNPGRIDPQTIEHIETVLWQCRRQDAALGPRGVLDIVLAQRDLVRSLLPQCPADLRSRLLSALSDSSRLAGWLSFDLNDFTSADYYYEDARSLAHEAENVELGAFVLCEMSHSATWQRKPRIGVDHAIAASEWANRTSDMRLRAYATDVAARAYAADGQPTACFTALDAANAALAKSGSQELGYVHFYDEPIHIAVRGLCHLELHQGQHAAVYAQQSLKNLDHSHVRNFAFATANLGRAYAQSKEIDEAARLFGDAGEIAARNSSVRLIEVLKQGRADLQPWQHTTAVRALDDRLTAQGLVLP